MTQFKPITDTLLASGQITMRKVDGWQTLAEKPAGAVQLVDRHPIPLQPRHLLGVVDDEHHVLGAADAQPVAVAV